LPDGTAVCLDGRSLTEGADHLADVEADRKHIEPTAGLDQAGRLLGESVAVATSDVPGELHTSTVAERTVESDKGVGH
jgi:hypothetical protein